VPWQLDLRSALVSSALLALLVDGLILLVYRSLPADYRPSLRWWLAGGVLGPLGFLMLVLGDASAVAPGILAAHVVTAAALACSAVALRMFQGVPQRRVSLAAAVLLVALDSYYFSFLQPSVHWRTVSLSVLYACLLGSNARAIFRRDGPTGAIPSATGAVFAIGSALMATRGLLEMASLQPAQALIFPTATAAVLPFGLLGVLPLLSTVGFLLMCTERSQAELERAAHLDYLTGICNRRAIEDLARRAIAAARRHGMPMAMMIVDIDHFKRINDAFGHECGDLALVESVRRLRDSLRAEDLVGRLGGEEFVAVMPNTDGVAALAAAERVRAAFADSPMHIGEHELQVTVTAGVAVLTAEDAQFSHLLRRADRAMYAGKNAGRNQVMLDGGSPMAADVA
jgi:diguanylate cyclase (GGDEF)-like protein